MPVYEYQCDDCGKSCELLLRSASEKPTCPECGSVALSKKFSTFSARNAQAAEACCSTGSCPVSDRCPSAGACCTR